MQINQSLIDLGFTENEVSVYLTLLKLGKGTAYQIGEVGTLRSSTVSGVLDSLRKKGAVLKAPHAKKQVFVPKYPTELIEDMRSRVNKAESVLPQLLAFAPKQGKINVLYYEGIKGIEDALRHRQDVMTSNEIVGFYAHSPDDPGPFGSVWTRSVKRIAKKSVHTRGIMPNHKSSVDFARANIEKHQLNIDMRILPLKDYSSLVSIEISDHLILIVSRHKDQAVIIENEDVANTLQQLFELQWLQAKPI